MPQDPFLLADGGVLHPAPAPLADSALYFDAVWGRPVGLPSPERDDASDAALSSTSSLDWADGTGLHHNMAQYLNSGLSVSLVTPDKANHPAT